MAPPAEGTRPPGGQRHGGTSRGGDKNPPATAKPPRTLFGALRGVAHGQAELSPAEGGDSDMRGGPGDTVQRLGHVGRPLQQHVLGTRQWCHRETVALLGGTSGSGVTPQRHLVVSPCSVTPQSNSLVSPFSVTPQCHPTVSPSSTASSKSVTSHCHPLMVSCSATPQGHPWCHPSVPPLSA